MKPLIVGTLISLIYFQLSHSVFLPRESVMSLRDKLLKNYRKEDRPIKNHYRTCFVHLRWSPMFMYDFDEVSGILSMVSNFILYWNDDYLKWNTKGTRLPRNIVLNKNLIWTPELAILNSAETSLFDKRVLEKEKVRVLSNGQIHYRTPAKVLKTLCTPNMEFYPIDEHSCVQEVLIKDYYPHELQFGPGSKLLLAQYQNSSTWEVKEWKLTRGKIVSNSFSGISLTVVFRRKPAFILLNMISPVLLLSVINVFVFGLPVVSGERISYSMTTFLSLAVYMTIIAEKLPDGNPVPMFTYFIVGKLVYSSLIILCTIIGLQLHHGKESVLIRKSMYLWAKLRRMRIVWSKCFAKFGQTCFVRKSKVREIHVATVDSLAMSNNEMSTEKEKNFVGSERSDKTLNDNESKDAESSESQKAKWKRIAKMFDRTCLVVFLLIVMTEIVTWIILTWFS